MVHDTVSSVAVTSRRMALRRFVPGVAAPIMPIPWNVPAPSSVLNAHPMECSSSIQCFECPSHGMFQQPSHGMFQLHPVFWMPIPWNVPASSTVLTWWSMLLPMNWVQLLGRLPAALFLDRVQQIVKERFDLTVRWRKLRSMQVFNAVPGTSQVVQCNTKSSPKDEMMTFGLAACNRALNYPEKLFWLQVLSSLATATTTTKLKVKVVCSLNLLLGLRPSHLKRTLWCFSVVDINRK